MKKLTKIRIINWHYLANETIIIKNNVLLTGQNASGKSTILDAIFFVITAGETQFNLAANEKGKRELRGYVKCKLGTANAEYLRNGDVTGHIALEFYDDVHEKYTTVGVAIDAFGELLPVKLLFWEANKPIDNKYFTSEENQIYGTVDFRKHNKDFDYYLTRKEAKKAFRIAFGSISEDFFKLLPKALAFKPIPDVKEFIYQNILEEKEIDVSPIVDSIRSYKELEGTLNLIKDKINDLKYMQEIYNEIKQIDKRQRELTYLIGLFGQEKIIDDSKKASGKIEELEVKKSLREKDYNDIEKEVEALQERSKELYLLLSNNDDFKATEYIDKRIASSQKQISNYQMQISKFVKVISTFNEQVDSLKKVQNRKIYQKISELPIASADASKVESVKLDLVVISREIKELIAMSNQQLGSLNSRRTQLISEINDVRNAIENLKDNRVRYNPSLMAIRNDIQDGLKKLYRVDISVHIFSELLDISNRAWHDTVEIYLGNRRFDLIVEPRYFDAALQIFSRVKSNYKLYGVGLVNTKFLDKYQTYSENSLASIITTENLDARRYINMSCGNVIMVDHETDLEKYPTSVTNNGLSYSRHTVRSLNPNIDKPFIGKGAANEQLQQQTTLAGSLRDAYMKINNEITSLSEEIKIANNLDFNSIIEGLDNPSLLAKEEDVLKELIRQKELQSTDNDSSDEIQNEYDKIDRTIKNYEADKVRINKELGSIDNAITNQNNIINHVETSLSQGKEELAKLIAGDLAFEQEAKKLYEEAKKEKSIDRSIIKFQNDLSKAKEQYESISNGLVESQFSFIRTYNSSLTVGVTETPKFLVELDKLERSELVQYEQKVRQAREAAEVVFKEDFLSKLRNNIMTAESEMQKINDTLYGINFGNDSYQFIFPKSKDYAAFYDMVTTDIDESASGLLSYDFQNKYQQQLEQLFASIAIDETNSKGAINKFTDYRTYMDYDIKITTKAGETMLYSKIFREKSGGETQVPFYVSMLASFVRVYAKNKLMNSEPIGIVLFDEVFDKMDGNRMNAMMTFISSLPLQVILACPPQRMSLLSPFADTILVMVRNNNKSQVMSIAKNAQGQLIDSKTNEVVSSA